MSRLADIRAAARLRDVTRGQISHLAIAFLMVLGAASLLRDTPGPRILWLSSFEWAWVSILLAIAHQIIVALVFRLQLYTGFMTRLFAGNDLRVWGAIFFPLLLARPITLLFVGLTDAAPITSQRQVEIAVGAVFVAVALYTLYSVVRYFTLPRALGGDHFRDEIIALPMVREGAFRLTGNAMYGLAFLGLWGIALLCGSWNALIVALFQHAYIWVHMYLIEAPDMDQIYGKAASTQTTLDSTPS